MYLFLTNFLYASYYNVRNCCALHNRSNNATMSTVKETLVDRKAVIPNPSRFQPSEDPASIHVPGLDTTASINDQIDQVEQLITFKLQVQSSVCTLSSFSGSDTCRTSMRTFQRYRVYLLQNCYQLSNGMLSGLSP